VTEAVVHVVPEAAPVDASREIDTAADTGGA
jgi:hypothetical protein